MSTSEVNALKGAVEDLKARLELLETNLDAKLKAQETNLETNLDTKLKAQETNLEVSFETKLDTKLKALETNLEANLEAKLEALATKLLGQEVGPALPPHSEPPQDSLSEEAEDSPIGDAKENIDPRS